MSSSAISLPETQLGVLTTPSSNVLQEFPVPHPGPGEVMVRNVVVASNPKDWKYAILFKDYSSIEGNDVAGTIAEVGEGVSEFKVGDRVAAFSKMVSMDPKYGGYAEYTVAPANTTFLLGSNTAYEDAVVLPLTVMTAVIGLFVRLGVQEPPKTGSAASSGETIVINGASSSVGSYAVKLAKRAGLFVIGIAGASAEYAKEVGADVVVDYRKGEDLEPELIRASKGREVSYVFDAVTSNGSAAALARFLSKTCGSKTPKLTFLLPVSDEERAQFPANVEAELTFVRSAHEEDAEFATKYYRLIAKWLDEGSFEGNRARVVPGGLAGVDEGLGMLKRGEVHAEKLVYRIAETPGLTTTV